MDLLGLWSWPQGLKAALCWGHGSARLKPCPDTKPLICGKELLTQALACCLLAAEISDRNPGLA
jgi:hypothetical protein